jgi:hypothetical protein
LYEQYANLRLGSITFWKKVEKLLENDVVRKTVHLDSEEVAAIVNALAIKNCKN